MEELHRLITERAVELRAAPEGSSSPGVLFGYAVVFNTESRDLGGWREVIDPAAFVDSLEQGLRVMCRQEHMSALLLGTTDAGTLRVTLDEIGVAYECDLPDTNAGRDAAALAARGDLRFSSFAFHEFEAELDMRDDNALVWRVTRAQLVDVAPVADPAYWTSSVAKRDIEAARAALAERTAGDEPARDTEVAGLALRDATAARLRLLGNREGE